MFIKILLYRPVNQSADIGHWGDCSMHSQIAVNFRLSEVYTRSGVKKGEFGCLDI